MRRRSFLALTAGFPAWVQGTGTGNPETASDWTFLDNGQIRLGIRKSSGACIGWFSRSGPGAENLLDHWDHGRSIQQSYYGAEDGSRWAEKPWRWNPVQGGDYRGTAAEVSVVDVPSTVELHSRTLPRNWAGGELLRDVVMEQWIRLEGLAAHLRFRFEYSGTQSHPAQDQEIPAFFCVPSLGTLVTYDGDRPWSGDGALRRVQPGWPNEYRAMTEGWAAYVNGRDEGIGIFVPRARRLTCYRYGKSPEAPGACSYLAPLDRFAITPGFVFDYRFLLSLGKVEDMRSLFGRLRETLTDSGASRPGA